MRRVFQLIVAAMIVLGGIARVPAAAAEIATGAKVPAGFKAVDASGKARNWVSIAGKKGTVLVLFRSAKWCPYCQAPTLQKPYLEVGVGIENILKIFRVDAVWHLTHTDKPGKVGIRAGLQLVF